VRRATRRKALIIRLGNAWCLQAFDMAYMLNGKYALKHDPTLTGRHTGKYL
jgi:hypothetical protein